VNTAAFDMMEKLLTIEFNNKIAADPKAKKKICGRKTKFGWLGGIYDPMGWDIHEFHEPRTFNPDGCGTCKCKETVTVNGKCYISHEVNYYLWGLANRLCGHKKKTAKKYARIWAKGRPDSWRCKVKWTEAGFDGVVNVAGCRAKGCRTTCKKRLTSSPRPYLKGLHKTPYRLRIRIGR